MAAAAQLIPPNGRCLAPMYRSQPFTSGDHKQIKSRSLGR